jgi:hypothetical protein
MEKTVSDAQNPAMQTEQTAKEIIVIGELHGTEEIPRLFNSLVSVAAKGRQQADRRKYLSSFLIRKSRIAMKQWLSSSANVFVRSVTM